MGKHPMQDRDLYTPWNSQVAAYFEMLYDSYGSWRMVAEVTHTRLKALRLLRNGSRKAISSSLMERFISTTGLGHMSDFTWFTAEDIEKLGIWNEVTSTGPKRRKRREKKPEPQRNEFGIRRRYIPRDWIE